MTATIGRRLATDAAVGPASAMRTSGDLSATIGGGVALDLVRVAGDRGFVMDMGELGAESVMRETGPRA